MIEVPKTVVRSIEDHAREAFPEECCGFLIGVAAEPRRVVDAVRAKNIAPGNRGRRYLIDPLELLHTDNAARTRNVDLVGIYHSHPNHPAAPSEFDRSRASGWYTYLILRVDEGIAKELTAWHFDEAAKTFRPEKITVR